MEKTAYKTQGIRRVKWHWLLVLIFNSSFLILTTSCHKTCVCKGYDGSETYYSDDEVDDHGVTCANMIYQAGRQFYSVCDWE